MTKGPSYREPRNVQWNKFLIEFKDALNNCTSKWAQLEHLDTRHFVNWKNDVLQKVTARVNVLRRRKTRFHPLLDKGVVKDALVTLQDRFVFVPTDKAGNNIAIVCKKTLY